MTQKVRVVVIMGVLVSVIMLEGRTCVTSADDLRRIVSFRPITSTAPLCSPLPLLPNGYCIDLTTTLGYQTALAVVAASGSMVIGSSNVHKLWISNALLIKLPASNITGALSSLLQSLYVLDVSTDPIGWVGQIIPFLGTLGPEHYDWGLQWIHIPEVHQQWSTLKGSGVTVVILDTGIDLDHPDLNIGNGANALAGGGSNDPVDNGGDDDHGHGTHMAGIIGATVNGVGTKGAAPEATVVPVKVLDSTGSGYLSDFLRGLQWVSGTNIRLANMSIQFRQNYHPLERAIQRLSAQGIIMVAAAGNRCSSGPPEESGGDDAGACDPSQIAVTYPAAYSGVIAVAATDFYNQVTAYSRSGPALDLVAPGGSYATGIRILSTNKGEGAAYGYGSGTSQAAAHVTGICTLALALQPQISFEAVLDLLKLTATPLQDPQNPPNNYPPEKQGAGLSDAEDLVEALQAPQ
jgi:subtilisin/minor extracellular protease Epr